MNHATPATANEQRIRDFLFDQLECWNTGRKEDFLSLWRAMAIEGLTLEYVAKQTLAGDAAWAGLNRMWDSYNPLVRLQLAECIVNGEDAALYFRNRRLEGGQLSTGIEVYSFKGGALHARFFH